MSDMFSSNGWTRLSVIHASYAHSKNGEVFDTNAETDKYQFGLKMTGRTEVIYGDHEFDFRAGTLFCLPKATRDGIIYHREIVESGHGAYVFFDSPERLFDRPALIRLSDPEKVYEAFSKFVNLYKTPAGDRLLMMAAFYKFLSTVKNDIQKSERPGESDRRMSACVEYIDEHFTDEYIDIDELAAISGMKPEYFRHSFSKAFGVPPLRYINRLKLERAKLLLSEGRSVNDTAAAVGFASANYFTRFFRERTGLTPTEFVRRGLC